MADSDISEMVPLFNTYLRSTGPLTKGLTKGVLMSQLNHIKETSTRISKDDLHQSIPRSKTDEEAVKLMLENLAFGLGINLKRCDKSTDLYSLQQHQKIERDTRMECAPYSNPPAECSDARSEPSTPRPKRQCTINISKISTEDTTRDLVTPPNSQITYSNPTRFLAQGEISPSPVTYKRKIPVHPAPLVDTPHPVTSQDKKMPILGFRGVSILAYTYAGNLRLTVLVFKHKPGCKRCRRYDFPGFFARSSQN